MKRLLAICTGLFLSATVLAQSAGEHEVIMRAMQDELKRNQDNLQLGQYKQPYYLEYNFGRSSNFEVMGSLGSVLNSYQSPQTSKASVRLLLGDTHRTSDAQYEGRVFPIEMPSETNYDEIRRRFWLATDVAYKSSIQEYAYKMAYLQSNPKSEEEEKLDDFSKADLKDCMEKDAALPSFDKSAWEERIARLSAIFKEYPKLFNSSVVVSGIQSVIYKCTNENLKEQVSLGYVTLFAQASVLGNDGVKISDAWSIHAASPDEYPSDAELEKQIRAFADGLMRLSEVEPIAEFYSGPILFEGGACSNILTSNLLNPGRLMAWRKPEGGRAMMTIDNRMGRKIIDSRLSVTNKTALKSYGGKSLWGSYSVDADGVVPAKEQVLVEDGILRSQLNGRIPTLKAPKSTGSSRFVLPQNAPLALTAPGTIHIETKDGLQEEKMKKALLKAAKEEGLDYAYIVKKVAGPASLIYRVDAKTGKETQVRAGDLQTLDLAKIKRIREISAKENVLNYLYGRMVPSSLIYPASILLDDVEINVSTQKAEQADALVFPLQRKK